MDREESRALEWVRATRLWRATAEVLLHYRQGREASLPRWQRALATPAQLGALTIRELIRDGLPTMAGSLAYMTALTLVPLLSVATSLLAAFGLLGSTEVVSYVQQMFPTAAHDITTYLHDFTERSARTVGGIGGVVLLVVGIYLFNAIERAFTRIWRGSSNRPVVTKFLMLYTLISLGPIFIALSIVETARAQIFISRLGLDTRAIDHLLPFVMALVVFTLMNKILPNAVVSWRSALTGGLFTAVAFELSKRGFNVYVAEVVLESYDKIYGALGLIPLSLAWVYLLWFVVLLGAELAYCSQHMERMLRTEVRWASLDHRSYEKGSIDPMVGLELFAPVAYAFKQGRGAISEHALSEMTHYNNTLVREVVTRLVRARVLQVAGRGRGHARLLMPARPLDDIRLIDVIEPLRDRQRPEVNSEALDALIGAIFDRDDEVFSGRTAADLVERAAAEEQRGGSGAEALERALEEISEEPEDDGGVVALEPEPRPAGLGEAAN